MLPRLTNLRRAMWALARRPAFAITAALSLGVGIGSTTMVLSVVNAVLLRPLPYATPDRLVAIAPDHAFAQREVEAIGERAKSYDIVASVSPGWLMALTDVPAPRQLDAARVSGQFFGMLGIAPMLGRTFGADAELPDRGNVAVLSYELWQASFGGDPKILGRSIVLNRESYVVVAVMPRAFRALGFRSDLWTPMTRDPSAMWWTGATQLAYARVRPGVSVRSASAELTPLLATIQRDFHLRADWLQATRVVGLRESMVGAIRPTLIVLFAAVVFLLALATANVATLGLVRAAERRHELAVRASLGASVRQIAMVLLVESVVLGAAGGIIGVALAYAGTGILHRVLPPSVPRIEEIAVDGRVLAAALAVTGLVSVLFGLVPLAEARIAGVTARLRAGRTTTGAGARARRIVVSLEVALALVLAIGATLMGRTLVALADVDPGLRADRLLTMRLQPTADGDDARRAYWHDVLARVRALPGVVSAATVMHLPLGGRAWDADITVEGRARQPDAPPPRAHWQVVSPMYFATAGIPIVRGRDFRESDGAHGPRVIAVNSAFAARLFPGEDPIGHRLRATHATDDSLATIVAVVGSVRHDSLNVQPGPEVYVPLDQKTVFATGLMVRTREEPAALVAAIRGQIVAVDRNVPISDVRTMSDILAASLGRQRMMLTLLGVFASMGLLLSAVGIYGVVAYGVRQRTREMGIRMALGANTRAIYRLVVGEGVGYAALGVIAGVPVALALTRLMRGLVYGVSPTDPISFALIPTALVIVATAASWIPAHRAAAIAPTTALNHIT